MYDNILIPYDGTKDGRRGAEHATELAAALDATVHGLYVVEKGTNPWMSESMDDQLDRAREWGQEQLEDVGDMADDQGVDFVSATAVGPAAHKEINEYVEEEDMDLIVMGSGYYGRMGGLLGGTADKVVRTADVPVTTLRRTEQE